MIPVNTDDQNFDDDEPMVVDDIHDVNDVIGEPICDITDQPPPNTIISFSHSSTIQLQPEVSFLILGAKLILLDT